MGRLRSMKRWHVVAAGAAGLVVAGALVATFTGNQGNDVTMALAQPDRVPASAALAPTGGAGMATIANSGVANSGVANSSVANSSVGDDAGAQKQLAAPSPTGQSEIGPVPPTSTPGQVVPGALKIVRTGELRVNVGKDGFAAAFDRVAAIAAAHGGFVAGSSTSTFDNARSGELTVRVPADKFDAARRDLGALGKVESQSLRGEDVSGQLVDYEARLKSLAAQEDALRTLVGKAVTVGEVLQVQTSLFDVRQQIEQLTAQRANLEQAASLSTLQVSLFEPGAAFEPRPTEPEKGLAGSFGRAVDAAESVVGGMMVVVGWLTPLVLLGLVGWGASRLFPKAFRRRRSRPTPDEAPAAG